MIFTYLTGRNRTGAEPTGTLIHAVEVEEGATYPSYFGKALCGAEPGRRSNGWSDYRAKEPTCPKCIKRLATMGQTE